MIILVISFIYSLFSLKARLVNGNIWHDYKISFYIACINGAQIKIMNYIYYYIAEYLNNWENHFSLSSKNNSFAKKLILFDFVNSYSSIFYIAFVKPYHEGCINNNCRKEIETQMYSIFLVYICVFFGELIYLYMIYYYQKEKVGALITEEKIEVQLDKLPVFVKGGRIVSLYNTVRRSGKLMGNDRIIIRVYLDENGHAEGEIYNDDGESTR